MLAVSLFLVFALLFDIRHQLFGIRLFVHLSDICIRSDIRLFSIRGIW